MTATVAVVHTHSTLSTRVHTLNIKGVLNQGQTHTRTVNITAPKNYSRDSSGPVDTQIHITTTVTLAHAVRIKASKTDPFRQGVTIYLRVTKTIMPSQSNLT